MNDILSKLNGFHQNLQFTYKLEKNNQLAFLDVLLICDNMIETTVYRNPTNSDIYLNWKWFSPCSWKRGTLKKTNYTSKFKLLNT